VAEQPPEPDETGLPPLTDTQLQGLADEWGLDVADLTYPTTPARGGSEPDDGDQRP
jgi:hypothetical protein